MADVDPNLAAAAAGADKGAAGAGADTTLAGAAAGADKAAGDKGAGAAAAAGAADKGSAAAADKGAAGEAAAADKGAAAQSDWRTRIAGGDKELEKILARYTDEAAVGKAFRAQQLKITSGELKKALPENASAEELAAWRKDNGIPDKAEGYLEKLELPKGVVIGDADKPIVAKFAEAALAGNTDPKQFSGMVAQYYAMLDEQKAAQQAADAAFHDESVAALEQLWPNGEYRKNTAAVNNLLAGWPDGLATRFLAARTPDGRMMGDDPTMIRQLAAVALELNPVPTLVPAGGGDPVKGIETRLGEIRKLRQESPDKYEADKKLQAEELELIDAQLKLKKRAG